MTTPKGSDCCGHDGVAVHTWLLLTSQMVMAVFVVAMVAGLSQSASSIIDATLAGKRQCQTGGAVVPATV